MDSGVLGLSCSLMSTQQAECGYNMVENFIHDSGLDFIRSIQGEWVLD
jgi:hypothetical protein